MKTIGDIVKGRELYSVQPDTTVLEAAEMMTAKNVGAVAVLEQNRLVGVLSERDVLRRVVVKKLDPAAIRVGEVMTQELVLADVHDSYDVGVARMHQARVRHLLLVSGDRFQGVVSLRDLLEVDVDEKDRELKLMSDYIHYVPPYAAH
jgi:CBS domain-containing protein